MNLRKQLYFAYHHARGGSLPRRYAEYVAADRAGIPAEATTQRLIEMLEHCRRQVPYYTRLMNELGDSYKRDPQAYLLQMPVLTKDIIRSNFQELKSRDLAQRRWFVNTSGGSTGEPAKFVQDQEFWDRTIALNMLFSTWAGREVGQPLVMLWGSVRDILAGSEGLKGTLQQAVTNTTLLNTYRMSPSQMRAYIALLNKQRPKLIIAYTQAIYELAKFAQNEQIAITPQSAIMTSAGTLHPFMREMITGVFQCPVFDRYGSREVGDMSCDCPAFEGQHIVPGSNYLEIVDDNDVACPRGSEGNILVTSLANFAMPLLRYKIGDLGILSAKERCSCGRQGQMLDKVTGRSADMFKRKDGALVAGGYFTQLLYFKEWVAKFQIVQQSYSSMVFKIVQSKATYGAEELNDIIAKTRKAMGDEYDVRFEFVDDIAPSASGKFRYTISEVS